MFDARGPQGLGPAEQRTSVLAIVALIFALLPCLGMVGLVLGIIALVQINDRSRQLKGRGLAIAAIAIPPVWTVLGILAAIAIPNFLMFQARSKQSEAKANLRALYTGVVEYQAEHDGRAPESFDDLAQPLSPHRRYAYFLGSSVTQPDLGGTYQLPPAFADPDQPGPVVYAVANLDSDPTLDVWSIDAQGKLVHLRDDVRN